MFGPNALITHYMLMPVLLILTYFSPIGAVKGYFGQSKTVGFNFKVFKIGKTVVLVWKNTVILLTIETKNRHTTE